MDPVKDKPYFLSIHFNETAPSAKNNANCIKKSWEINERSSLFLFEFFKSNNACTFQSDLNALAFVYTFKAAN